MDKALLLKINREWTNAFLDQVMVAFSSLSVWMPLFVVIVLAVAIRGRFKARAFLVVLALTIAVNDGLVARTLKYTVNRPRPHQTETGLSIRSISKEKIPQLAIFDPIRVKESKATTKEVEGRSFPSAHTMNTFAAATATWLFFRSAWWLLYLPATLVSYSRVYTASHWPSDILPSIVMGIALGLLVPVTLNRIWRKFGNHIAPTWHTKFPSLLPIPNSKLPRESESEA